MRTLLLGIVLAACAPGSGQGPNANTAAGNGSNEVCKEEAPTGTSIPRKVCRSPEQMEEERKSADDFLRNQRSRPTIRNN